MSEALFNIVFYGIIQPGKDRNTVVAEMAALFKAPPDKIKPYFSGDRKVIKSNINELNAEKYRVTLERIGMVIKIEPAESAAAPGKAASPAATSKIDTSGISLAEVGANVLDAPPKVIPVPIGDISTISMAEPGADVLTHPIKVTPTPIGDISELSMADAGADVLTHPAKVTPQPIADISGISVAETGADILKNPPQKKAAAIPDISGLSLKDQK